MTREEYFELWVSNFESKEGLPEHVRMVAKDTLSQEEYIEFLQLIIDHLQEEIKILFHS